MCVCDYEISTSIIVQEHNLQSYVHNARLTEGEGEYNSLTNKFYSIDDSWSRR